MVNLKGYCYGSILYDKTYFVPDNIKENFDKMSDEEIKPFEVTEEKWDKMQEHFPV